LGERGLGQGILVHFGKNGVTVFDHFDLQVELQAFEMAGLSFAVVGAEGFFGGAPIFQGFDGDFEQFAGALEIAVVLVDLVEGVNFGVKGVSSFHDWFVLC